MIIKKYENIVVERSSKMIIIVRKTDNKILSRYEAWELNAYENAVHDVEANGYTYISEEITMMGDMVIWVR